jgi:hypothetical protein
MRASIGPPGPELDFIAWTTILVGRLRELLPAVAAARRRQSVVLRYGGREATITDGGATRWVTFGIGSWLSIDSHDAFTARNVAKSLAGFFDVERLRPG